MDYKRTTEMPPLRAPQVQFTEATRSQPMYTGQAVGAVGGIMALTAIGLGVCLLFVTMGLGLSNPWRWSAVGVGVGAVTGLAIGIKKFDLMAVHTEEIVNDPAPRMQPAPAEDMAPWVLLDQKGGLKRKGDWGISSGLVTRFLQAGLAEEALGFAAWMGEFSAEYPGQGRDRYQTFREKLKRLGYAKDYKGSRGLALTEEGMDYAAEWLEAHGQLRQLDPPPPLAQLGTGEDFDEAGMQAHASTGAVEG